MHFKKIISVIVCVWYSQIVSAQFEYRQHDLYFHYGLMEKIKLTEWQAFADSYNSFLNPDQKIGDFKQQFCYDIGYRFSLIKFYSTLSYQHYHGRTTAKFSNSEQRQFDLFANAVSWGFGYRLINIEKKFNLNLVYNLRICAKTRIVSEYIYTDGFHSMGGEKDLNGTYLGLGTLGSELGFLMQYKINKKLSIELGVVKQWNNSVLPSTMDDKSSFKTFSGNGVETLPQDYISYERNPSQYILDGGPVVHDKSKGTKIMIGIAYTFSKTN